MTGKLIVGEMGETMDLFRPPSGADSLVNLADQNEKVADALRFYARSDWFNLYKAWEVVRDAAGVNPNSERRARLLRPSEDVSQAQRKAAQSWATRPAMPLKRCSLPRTLCPSQGRRPSCDPSSKLGFERSRNGPRHLTSTLNSASSRVSHRFPHER